MGALAGDALAGNIPRPSLSVLGLIGRSPHRRQALAGNIPRPSLSGPVTLDRCLNRRRALAGNIPRPSLSELGAGGALPSGPRIGGEYSPPFVERLIDSGRCVQQPRALAGNIPRPSLSVLVQRRRVTHRHRIGGEYSPPFVERPSASADAPPTAPALAGNIPRRSLKPGELRWWLRVTGHDGRSWSRATISEGVQYGVGAFADDGPFFVTSIPRSRVGAGAQDCWFESAAPFRRRASMRARRSA